MPENTKLVDDIKSFKESVLKNNSLNDLLSKEELEVAADFDGFVLSDYVHSSHQMIDELIINEEQFRTPKSKLMKLIELGDKLYASLFDLVSTIDSLNEHLTKDKDGNGNAKERYEILLTQRAIKGTIKELAAIQSMTKEQLKKLNIDSLKDVDWDAVKMETMVENAEAIVDFMEKNQQQVPMEKVSQQDRVLIKRAIEKRKGKPNIYTGQNKDIVTADGTPVKK